MMLVIGFLIGGLFVALMNAGALGMREKRAIREGWIELDNKLYRVSQIDVSKFDGLD